MSLRPLHQQLLISSLLSVSLALTACQFDQVSLRSPGPISNETPGEQKGSSIQLIIKGDNSLLPFSTQQQKGVCLNEIKSLRATITLSDDLNSHQIDHLTQQGIEVKGRDLSINHPLGEIQRLFEGVSIEFKSLTEGKTLIQTELLDQNQTSLGNLNYELILSNQSSEVLVTLKSAGEEDERGCPVLSADIMGANLVSAQGGLVLTIDAPDKSLTPPPPDSSPEPEPISTPQPTPSPPVLPQPQEVRVISRSSETLVLKWQEPEGLASHSYTVFLDGEKVAEGLKSTIYTFRNLKANHTYSLEVQSVTLQGRSELVKIEAFTERGSSGGGGGGGGSAPAPAPAPAAAPIVVPTITNLSSASGHVGSSLTLTGTNYDITPTNNSVMFGATAATVTAASATSLTVIIPTLTPGATNLTVTVAAQTSTASVFTVTQGEFIVNTFVTGNQNVNSVASDDNGNFVVTWSSQNQDGSGEGIYAQRFNHLGISQGSEFRVNTYTNGNQHFPSIAMDNDGDFVITWNSANQDGSDYGIYAQRYDNTGTAVGTEFQVNTYTTSVQRYPEVAMDNDGDFVITWEGRYQDGGDFGIFAQRYDNIGATVGTEFQVNTYTTGSQFRTAVAMDSDGDFVISWFGQGAGDIDGIFAQRYNSSGMAQGSEFIVNTYTNNVQTTPAMSMNNDGDFIISWISFVQDGSGDGIYAQRYNSSGNTVGTEFRVNTHTTNTQSLPDIAMDSDGDFVITWQSHSQDGDNYGIYAQRYNSSGATQGSEIQVNTYTTSTQNTPSVALDSDGDFVISWQSYTQDGGAMGVYAKKYNGSGTAQ